MFGTVIIDSYSKVEVIEIADALDDLCHPNDGYGWASAGIYCFWDYYAEEVLYLGLASDLATRFKQHNGLIAIEDGGSKKSEIDEYFSRNDRIGYTIFVQSNLSQPLTHRNKKRYEKFAKESNSPVEDMLSDQGKDDIKRVEGILIEAYRKQHGHLPPWNKVGGSIDGQNVVMTNNYNIVRSFCKPDDYARNPIVSRSTLRELSNNPTYENFENYYHAVRMYMLIFGMDYTEALAFTEKHDSFGYKERIEKLGYDKKKLIV